MNRLGQPSGQPSGDDEVAEVPIGPGSAIPSSAAVLSGLRIQQQLVQGKGQGGVGLVPPDSGGEIGEDAEVVIDHPGGMTLAWVDRCRWRSPAGGFRWRRGCQKDGGFLVVVELPLLAAGEMEGGGLVSGAGGPVGVNGALQAGGGQLDMGLAIVRWGVRFGWVGMDAGYGKCPGILRALETAGETIVADVHANPHLGEQDLLPAPPCLRTGRRLGRTVKTGFRSITVKDWVAPHSRDARIGLQAFES